MRMFCRGFSTLLTVMMIVSGVSFVPVHAIDKEEEPSTTQEIKKMEESGSAESTETSSDETSEMEEGGSSSQVVICGTRDGEYRTREIIPYGETELLDEQYATYEIFEMKDLVSLFGTSNVTVISDTEIKLIRDIDLSNQIVYLINLNSGNFSIDFDGHTCKGMLSFYICGGDITLLDSSGTNSGGIISDPIPFDENGSNNLSAIVVDGGKLTIQSGHYLGFYTTIFCKIGEIRIEGGVIGPVVTDACNTFPTIVAFASMTKAEITGGVFSGAKLALYCERDSMGSLASSIQSPLQISGGSFECFEYGPGNMAIVYVYGGAEGSADIEEIIAKDCIVVPGMFWERYNPDMNEGSIYTSRRVHVIQNTGVEGFVYRLYTNVLMREPDYDGFADWLTQIKNKQLSGSAAAFGFFFSPELQSRNLSDEEFITLLYNVFLDRSPDDDGMKTWLSALETGASRKYIFAGFANSQEWKNLCADYGIEPGTYSSDEARDQNLKVTAFVQRLYTLCLSRKADAAGLNDWTAALNSKSKDGAYVAYGFFFSAEFIGRNLSNEDYVDVLYQVLLGRGADAAGKADWVAQLKAGKDRMDVFRGFVHSKEFDGICAEYGIVRGTI